MNCIAKVMYKFSFQNAPHKNTTMKKKTFVEGKKRELYRSLLFQLTNPQWILF